MAKTVLVVDDVAFVRKTLTDILSEGHYQVVGEASDGAEAIAMYQKLRPDVVTMDVVMPKASGIDAARTICRMDKNARVIIISAMSQESLVMEAIAAGCKDYVLKPFTAQDILRAVERSFADDEGHASRASRG